MYGVAAVEAVTFGDGSPLFADPADPANLIALGTWRAALQTIHSSLALSA